MNVEGSASGAKQWNALSKRPTESGDPNAKVAARERASEHSQGSQFADLTAAAAASIPGSLGSLGQSTVQMEAKAPGRRRLTSARARNARRGSVGLPPLPWRARSVRASSASSKKTSVG